MTKTFKEKTIKSFVRRTGRITKAQSAALKTIWPLFGVGFDKKKLDLASLYKRKGPIILEIGFGNGETLVEEAIENPKNNYFGIEVHKPGIGFCLLKIKKSGVSNIKLSSHDAIEVIKYQIKNNSLYRVNLLFPDPWPKKKHHKRRIFQNDFIKMIAKKLVSDGRFHIATDSKSYAEHINMVISKKEFFKLIEKRQHNGNNPLNRSKTKFEIRAIAKGHRVWDWILEKHELQNVNGNKNCN